MMSSAKRSPDSKRTNPPREVKESKDFLDDWERLSRSGKQDMHRMKEAMMLIIANDAPLPTEWRDHKLNGIYKDVRECHVKGDLLLMYKIDDGGDTEGVTFVRAGTHSEIFPGR